MGTTESHHAGDQPCDRGHRRDRGLRHARADGWLMNLKNTLGCLEGDGLITPRPGVVRLMPRKLDGVTETRTFPQADSVGLPTPQADAWPVAVGPPVRTRGSQGLAAEPEPAE